MNEKSVCVQEILEKTNCARWPASHHLLWGGTRGKEGSQVLLVKSGLPFLLLSLLQPSDMNLLAGCSWTNYWYFKEMLWWLLLFSLIHLATTSSFSSNIKAWTDYCRGISFHWTLGKKRKKKRGGGEGAENFRARLHKPPSVGEGCTTNQLSCGRNCNGEPRPKPVIITGRATLLILFIEEQT